MLTTILAFLATYILVPLLGLVLRDVAVQYLGSKWIKKKDNNVSRRLPKRRKKK